MDTFKFIQQGGFSLEDNPNYDPTKKRNKEPKQIVVSNFGNSDDRFSELGLKTAKVRIKGQSTINVEMEGEAVTLDGKNMHPAKRQRRMK